MEARHPNIGTKKWSSGKCGVVVLMMEAVIKAVLDPSLGAGGAVIKCPLSLLVAAFHYSCLLFIPTSPMTKSFPLIWGLSTFLHKRHL